MKKTVYVETTVLSYLTARVSDNVVTAGRQQATISLWPKLLAEFDTYVSALVIEEGRRGDAEQARKRMEAIATFPLLDVDDEARALAENILLAKAVPAEYPEDALHIAVAAVNGIHVVVTWNFAHLNNPFTRLRIRQVVENAGYQCPEVCSPDELLEAET
jgi:predicted nucleic acid-binding protein